MTGAMVIQNDAWRMQVWPQFGGKVSSLIDKADGHELLLDYPLERPTRCQYGTRYVDGWYAGWDECFPAVDPGPYPLYPYENVQVPDHGELWALPSTAVPTRNGYTTVWHGLRFGYRLTRKLHLDETGVVAEYTLINLAPIEFRFVWAWHAMLSIASPVTVDFGDALHFRDPGGDGESLWPALDVGTDFRRSDELPAGRAWKRFSADPIVAHATVNYPQRKRSLRIAYETASADVAAYWGVWVNTGGWEGHRHLSIEPTTGRSDAIAPSIADGSAGRVGPGGRAEWTLRLTASASVV